MFLVGNTPTMGKGKKRLIVFSSLLAIIVGFNFGGHIQHLQAPLKRAWPPIMEGLLQDGQWPHIMEGLLQDGQWLPVTGLSHKETIAYFQFD